MSENKKIDLENPIFVFYVNVEGMSRQKSEELIHIYKNYFNYDNITTWVLACDYTKVECIYRKYNIEFLQKLSDKLEELTKCESLTEVRKNIRDFKLEDILK
jgi:DNA-dependent RNA polymerase auxiliary subunit epsilon